MCLKLEKSGIVGRSWAFRLTVRKTWFFVPYKLSKPGILVEGRRSVFLMMKIISLNIRALGGSVKRRYLRELICLEQVGMVCLQETKFSEVGEGNCFLLWGSNDIDWVENGASNNVGELITM